MVHRYYSLNIFYIRDGIISREEALAQISEKDGEPPELDYWLKELDLSREDLGKVKHLSYDGFKTYNLKLLKLSRHLSFSLLVTAGLLYIIFGTGPVSYWLLGNLEYRYPPLTSSNAIDRVDAIVVLAGHAEMDLNRSISSTVNSSSARRTGDYRCKQGVYKARKTPSEVIR